MKVGDTVKYINEVGEGKILQMTADKVLVEDGHGFEHWLDRSEVILKKEQLSNMISSITPQKEIDSGKTSKKHTKTHKSKWVVDLHIHELLDSSRGMTNSQIVSYQVNYAQKKIREAQKGRIRYVVLIHGKGTGRLRKEIRNMLKNQDIVSFYDATIDIIVSGATEIQIY